MQDAAERWDAMYRSGEYRQHWDSRNPSPYLCAMVAAGVAKAGDTTLDLGCGAGRNTIFLAARGCRSIGVDWSATALQIARQRAAEAGVAPEFYAASAFDLPLDDESVDFALDNGCLHGVSLDEWPAYAAELARVLKPGGCWLLAGGRQAGEAARTAITETHVDGALGALFERGPLVPVVAISDAGELQANLCLLVRR
jgi:ubiquinone/menaquinone biosynthesis C-methylase UbiE